MDATEFRANLKELSLTQRELAARLGVTTSTVNRWAKNIVPIPKYATAYLKLLGEYLRLIEYGIYGGTCYRPEEEGKQHFEGVR